MLGQEADNPVNLWSANSHKKDATTSLRDDICSFGWGPYRAGRANNRLRLLPASCNDAFARKASVIVWTLTAPAAKKWERFEEGIVLNFAVAGWFRPDSGQ
jgi:hypothetical protein